MILVISPTYRQNRCVKAALNVVALKIFVIKRVDKEISYISILLLTEHHKGLLSSEEEDKHSDMF